MGDLETAVLVTGPLDTPRMTRWRRDQLKLAQEVADRLGDGYTRSDVLRLAFDAGIGAVEAMAEEMTSPAATSS